MVWVENCWVPFRQDLVSVFLWLTLVWALRPHCSLGWAPSLRTGSVAKGPVFCLVSALHWTGADDLPQILTENLHVLVRASLLTQDKFRCSSKVLVSFPVHRGRVLYSTEGGNSFKRPWLSPCSAARQEGTNGGITSFKNLTLKHKVLAKRGRQGSYCGKTTG